MFSWQGGYNFQDDALAFYPYNAPVFLRFRLGVGSCPVKAKFAKRFVEVVYCPKKILYLLI
jgi:hypothetical protein